MRTDGDIAACEHCEKEFPFEQAVSSADGCYFCPQCYAAWKAEFDACAHDWDAEPAHDDHGEAGRYCRKCRGFILNEESTADREAE